MRGEMADMAKSLQRDPQMESIFAICKHDLGMEFSSGRSLGVEFAFNHGIDHRDGMLGVITLTLQRLDVMLGSQADRHREASLLLRCSLGTFLGDVVGIAASLYDRIEPTRPFAGLNDP